MWNLTGDDVQRAIEELKGRRAAIQARYDSEMKQLEADLADLDAFERLAVKIVADYVGEAAPSAIAAAAVPSAENSPPRQMPAEPSAEAEPAAGTEPAGTPKGSSRWRMRLGAGEGSR